MHFETFEEERVRFRGSLFALARQEAKARGVMVCVPPLNPGANEIDLRPWEARASRGQFWAVQQLVIWNRILQERGDMLKQDFATKHGDLVAEEVNESPVAPTEKKGPQGLWTCKPHLRRAHWREGVLIGITFVNRKTVDESSRQLMEYIMEEVNRELVIEGNLAAANQAAESLVAECMPLKEESHE